MQLYFLRHGLADRDKWSGNDFERPLTQEGKERMKREAKAMEEMGLELDRILCSPLTRARETAEIVARRLDMDVMEDERLAGQFDIRVLEKIVRKGKTGERIMLVGHEPSFSEVIGTLIGDADVVCKKGSLARVDIFSMSPVRGRLVWLIPPKALDT
jgi:phosphohistidine phosphatase